MCRCLQRNGSSSRTDRRGVRHLQGLLHTVGSGPFPTELLDEDGQRLRDNGNEYGSVTGRPRRCGWIDLVALRYTIMLNGVTKLVMMKSDVLDSFETIKACVAYRVNGEETEDLPYDISDGIEPVYVELPGWQADMTKMQSEDEFLKSSTIT